MSADLRREDRHGLFVGTRIEILKSPLTRYNVVRAVNSIVLCCCVIAMVPDDSRHLHVANSMYGRHAH